MRRLLSLEFIQSVSLQRRTMNVGDSSPCAIISSSVSDLHLNSTSNGSQNCHVAEESEVEKTDKNLSEHADDDEEVEEESPCSNINFMAVVTAARIARWMARAYGAAKKRKDKKSMVILSLIFIGIEKIGRYVLFFML